jgi:hypothetical protein
MMTTVVVELLQRIGFHKEWSHIQIMTCSLVHMSNRLALPLVLGNAGRTLKPIVGILIYERDG